jgi:hypothetical protein
MGGLYAVHMMDPQEVGGLEGETTWSLNTALNLEGIRSEQELRDCS